MARTVKIPLNPPVQGHEGPIAEVVVREPSYKEYMAIGEPWTVAYADNGTPFQVENLDVINRYVEICVVSPDAILLGQASGRTARRVREAVLNFFIGGDTATPQSPTSPTT